MDGKDINLAIEGLKLTIYQIINKSELPIGTVYYILKDVCNDLEKTYNEVLKNLTIDKDESESKNDEIIHFTSDKSLKEFIPDKE